MLLRAPESWPQPVVAVVAMVILAVLDLAGAVAAKEAVERRSYGLAVAGAVLYLLLFWVYASSLRVAELGPVTLGWIVVLQIGVLLVDRIHYGTMMPTGKWVAVAVLIVAQAYLLLGPSGETSPAADRQAAGRHVAGSRPAPRHAAGPPPPRRVAAVGAAAVPAQRSPVQLPVDPPSPRRNASVSVS